MNKKLLNLLAIGLLLSANSFSQMLNYQWAKSISSPANDRATHIQADASGNTYVVGNYSGLIDLDPSGATYSVANAGNSDMFVAKYNSAGNFVWGFGLGSAGNENAYCIKLVNNNIYITGQFQGTIDFDPGVSSTTLTTISTTGDGFFAKYDLNGNFVLARNFVASLSSAFSRGTGITADNSGNMYITGTYSGTVDFDAGAPTVNLTTGVANAMFFSKYNAAGTFMFANSTQNADIAAPWAITLDGLNNIIITGSFGNAVGQNVDFNPGAPIFNLTSTGSSDMFTAKYDNNGLFTWAFKVGVSTGTTITEGLSVKTDASDNVIVTGHYTNLSDFDPGPGTATLTVPTPTNSNIFVAKYSSAGTYSWAIGIGGSGQDVGNNLAIESSGNIFVTGTFSGTVDFDPGVGTFSLTGAGANDIFVARFSPAGTFSTAVAVGGNAADGVGGIALNATANELFLAGFYTGTADFDPSPSNFTMTAVGATDAFVEKFQFCVSAPGQPGAISGSTAMCSGAGATNYSIAVVTGATSYTWTLPGGWSGTSSTNTISATPGSSGIFTVTASNACGTSSAQTLSVTVNPLPVITASTTTTQLCIGNSATLTAGGGTSYTWNPGGAGASIVISPTVNTTYTVTGIDNNSCTNSTVFTQAVVNCTPSAISKNNLSGNWLSVYPNPAKDVLQVDSKITFMSLNFQLYNSLGELLMEEKISKEHTTINIQHLSKGIYFVKAGNVTRRIIKE